MARFLLAALGAIALLELTSAAIPSYIKICGRRNPQINKCVEESVRQLTPKLLNGIPEIEVPPLDPLYVDEIALASLDDFHAIATNVKIRGLSKFDVKYLKIDLKNQKIDFELNFNKVYMDADYDVKAKILVPIKEKGPIKTIAENVNAKVSLKLQIVERRGGKYVYFPTMATKLTIKDYEANFMPGAEANPITQAINSVLLTSRQEIIASMTPNIEKAISRKALEVANKMCKHYTYDELFPDTV